MPGSFVSRNTMMLGFSESVGVEAGIVGVRN